MSKFRSSFSFSAKGLVFGLLVYSGIFAGERPFPILQRAHAEGFNTPEAEDINEDKPFAQAHVIMQINDADTAHHNSALSIANNLLNHYGGADQVDVEIIAFAAGVPMFYAENNANAERIRSLAANGVRFYICGNTLDTIAHKTGTRPQVLPGVVEVPTGVAFLVEEMARGYSHVHP